MTGIIVFLVIVLLLWLLVSRLNFEPGAGGSSSGNGSVDRLARMLYRMNMMTRGPKVTNAKGTPPAAAPVIAPVDALRSQDPQARLAAAQELGAQKDYKAVPALIMSLDDADKEVREKAAWALSEIKDPRSIGPLIQAMKSDVSGRIEKAVVKMGIAAVEPLILALEGDDPQVRERATFVLKRIQEPLSIDALLAGLNDEDSESRVHASWELRSVLRAKKDPRAVEPLMAALNDEHPDVRSNAAEALGEIKDPRAVEALIRALSDPTLSRPAAWALGEIRDVRAIPALIQSLDYSEQNVRENAAAALVRFGAHVVDPLIAILKTGNVDAKQNAAWALGEIKDNRATIPLMDLLKHENMLVRSKAIESLGTLASPLAHDALVSMVRDSKPLVRAKAVQALAQSHHPDIMKPLLAALHDDNNFVRESAANALADLGNPRAIETLIEVVTDDRSGAVQKALVKLTGTQLANQEQWREWWKANKALAFRSH